MKTTPALILILFACFLSGCNKNNLDLVPTVDDIVDNISDEIISLEEAKLSDFPLFAITPVSIQITDPVIVNNEETAYGAIDIVVPATTSLDEIYASITSDALNLSKFKVLPGYDTGLNFETQSHIYTVVNVFDESEELLHYTVTIAREAPPVLSTLTVTDFAFEVAHNPQFTQDITIEKRVDEMNRQDIYLFVPEGTDYSALTPTATFDAEQVFYTQDPSISIYSVDTPYPSEATRFDFSYPNRLLIVLADEANDRMKWVNVFVDVKNPVQLEDTDITTPDVVTASSATYFGRITKWKNVGNHPVEFQSATTYENRIPDYNIDLVTAFREYFVAGLMPGQTANVTVVVRRSLPVMTYQTTAVFHTGFVGHDGIDAFVEPVKLNITANVVYE